MAGGEEILMDGQGKFAQSIHGSMGIITEEPAVIFRKGNIQKPVHRLNLPMFPRQSHKLFRRIVTAGNIIADFMAGVSANLNTTIYGENCL